MTHQSGQITQVSPEDSSNIITQVPEEKPKFAVTKTEGERVRKKEGSGKRRSSGIFKKYAAIHLIRYICCGRSRHAATRKNVSIVSSDTSTTLAPNAAPPTPASSKNQTNPRRNQRSRSFFSMFFCCAWSPSIPDAGMDLQQTTPPSDTQTDTAAQQQSLQTSEQTPTIQESENEKIEDNEPVTSTPQAEPVAEPDEQNEHKWLLDPVDTDHIGRKCLVLDLDETLVHSSFKQMVQADFVVPVEIENQNHNVYVVKRPGVDQFLKKMGEMYEIVVFTASLSKYADPVLDKLDQHQVVRHRLFRESCYNHKGNYVKDLSQLGRELRDTIIIDNSPASYIFHPTNAVPISSWFNDPHDTELVDLIPFLEDLTAVDDVMMVLDCSNEAR